MPGKYFHIALLGCLLLNAGAATAQNSSGLNTLFTTPQERLLINANRYKRDEVPVQQPEPEPEQAPVQILVREEVSVDYQVSGISVSPDGAHTAWINATAYENGARLDDGSRVSILTRDGVRVRITAPDGKQYYATSGETLTVTYMAAVEN